MECSWKRRKAGRQRLGEKWRAHAATCTCARFALRRVNAPPTRLVVATVATTASASAIKKEKRTRDDEVGWDDNVIPYRMKIAIENYHAC